jgi:preprotein translocase subunit YajC
MTPTALFAPALALLETPPSSPGFGGMLVPIVLIVGIFWLVVIGPERRQRKAREAMLSQIAKGDKVITTGGLHGVVAAVQEQMITLQVDEGVRLRFTRAAIQTVVDESKREGETTPEKIEAPSKGAKKGSGANG